MQRMARNVRVRRLEGEQEWRVEEHGDGGKRETV